MDGGDSEESDPNRIRLDLRWIQQCATQVRIATFSSHDEILLLETAECKPVLSQNCVELVSMTKNFEI